MDALDNIESRLMLENACVDASIPMVHGAMGDVQMQIAVIKQSQKLIKMMPTGRCRCRQHRQMDQAGSVTVGAGSSQTAGAKTGDYASIVRIGMQMIEEVKKAREG